MVQWKTGRIIFSLGVAVASATMSAPGAMAAEASGEPIHLRFTFWGSAFEKKDITAAIDAFNATHPGIIVEGQHIPNAGYVEKITTQLAAGDPPDIAYLDETQAFPWSAEGKLLDLTRQRELRRIARLDQIAIVIEDQILHNADRRRQDRRDGVRAAGRKRSVRIQDLP